MSRRILVMIAAALAVAGCGKEKNVDPPAELVRFTAQLDVGRAWSAGLRGGDEVLRLGLAPALLGDRVCAAGHGGDVQCLEAATGKSLWRSATRLPLGGGPGVGEGLVAVGSTDGQVLALDAGSGAERWRVPVGGEVLAAPAVGGGLVVVRTVDGRVIALRASDGGEAWSFEQQVPRLTLRGTAPPVIHGDVVLAAFDNGRVVALALSTGDLLWSTTVAPSRGRTEIERLVDIDAPVHVRGQDIYVAGYQGRIAMLALESGQAWWGRELSSHRGLALAGDGLYVTAADSVVVSLSPRDGTERWRQEAFLRRALTAPAVHEAGLVFGDFDGYLHWLDPADGSVIGRASAGGRISHAPLVAGELVIVQTDKGELQAFRARSRAAR